MGLCGAADPEGSSLCDGVKLSDCLRAVPQPSIHNCEYQDLAALISQGFFGRIGEIALGDGGCFVAAPPAEYLDAALVIGASPGGVGQPAAASPGYRPVSAGSWAGTWLPSSR